MLSCMTALILSPSNAQETHTLKVLYWNIQNGMWADQGNNYDNFVEFVESEDPDICIWAEAESRYRTDTSVKMEGCEEAYLPYNWDLLARRYGHQYVCIAGKRDTFPQVVTSKYPVRVVNRINGNGGDIVVVHGAGHVEVDGVQDLLFDLLRKARSSGIYFIFASQRFSLANINPESKSNLCSKVLFKMSNTASANTVADNLTQQIVNLPPSREFIADYQDGVYQGKTLQLTEEQMVEYIKPHIDKNHKLLDFNKKMLKNDQKIVENDDFLAENDQKNAKNNKKIPRFSKIKR